MNPFFSKIILVIAFFNLVFCSTTSLAKQKENRKISENMKSIIKSHALIVSRWVKSPVIINSVIEQNNKNISLQEIKAIDKEWIEGKQNEFAKSLQQNQVGQQLEAAV